MAYLADVNFLIALLHARHAHSEKAVAWLEHSDRTDSIALCRVAQMGVLRILTNASWLREEAMAAADVWDGWDLLLTDRRFMQVVEPAQLEKHWRRLTRDWLAGRSAETDSYLAAFAAAGGYKLLTFDRGIRRFAGLDAEILG